MNEVAWESLIKDRMRPCIRLKEEDPGKRNSQNQAKRREKMAYRKAYKKAYEQTPQRKAYNEGRGKRYHELHKDEQNAKHREYNASEHGKQVNAKTNKAWRERNKEYDKQRKAEWWRKTHPNPKPIGRPKKIKEQDETISATP